MTTVKRILYHSWLKKNRSDLVKYPETKNLFSLLWEKDLNKGYEVLPHPGLSTHTLAVLQMHLQSLLCKLEHGIPCA